MEVHPFSIFEKEESSQSSLDQSRVYLDHNATAPLAKDLGPALTEALFHWGNPSSIHFMGRGPKNILREARKNIASSIGASPLEIIFTSGGSESNTTVLKGLYDHFLLAPLEAGLSIERTEIVSTQIEHPSVIKTLRLLEARGMKLHLLPVDRLGRIDLAKYEKVLSSKTAFVSVMLANNETGTLLPVKKMAEIAHRYGALFHTDAVQGLGKIPVNVQDLGVDYATFSGHKFYSLKGSGFIYSKQGAPFYSMILGGGQERHRRGGTENTLAQLSLGLMARKISEVSARAEQIQGLRDLLEKRILEEISGVQITASESERLPNTSSLIIAGVDGETLLMSLDMKGFSVSTGAACSSGNPEPSPVLLAMGLTRAEAQSSLRVSLGWENTEEQISKFVETLKTVVARLRSIGREYEKAANEIR
ncbi:MAG: cysteine desulfurase family protein [Pseudobdellovibrionaceae bacterium]